MTNLLYRCALPEDVTTKSSGPREVLLRLYGSSHDDLDTQLEIFNQLAAERLGPALYCTFVGGRFEEYLPSNPLLWSEMTDEMVSAAVARKIAAIHKLNIKCLDQESRWLSDRYRDYYEFIKNASKMPLKFREDTLDSTKMIANELMAIDFKQEIDYLEKLFQETKAPLVFSHNDLHQNNILLLDKLENNRDLTDRVVLIDFEYCSYNYRPFDLANHLSEWCFDYCCDEYPNFSASTDRFPSMERQRQFIKHYIDEMGDIALFNNGVSTTCNANTILNEEDRIDVLLNEMQPFLMASNLLWTLWAIKSACTSTIKFGYWVSMLPRLKIMNIHDLYH